MKMMAVLESRAYAGAMRAENGMQATGGARLMAAARGAFAGLADLALPPHCLACDRRVADEGGLCPACWAGLRLIERPYCERLGVPFAYDAGAGALSPEAIAEPPPFERCRAVAVFDDVARRLVHGLKYRDRLDLATWMAGWMVRAGSELTATADVVVPVPLHRRRLWWRRFNQSASLAQPLARMADKRFAAQALKRQRPTRPQVGLSGGERQRNLRGAFAVADEAAIRGQRVLLIDDVYTTGATAGAATRALMRSGAAAVDVLVFARVVRGAL